MDRVAGDEYLKVFPGIAELARASRGFLTRSVTWLAEEAGIRQFLDIGTGLPTADNTHKVVQRAASDSRIVYVDNDPIVLAQYQASNQHLCGERAHPRVRTRVAHTPHGSDAVRRPQRRQTLVEDALPERPRRSRRRSNAIVQTSWSAARRIRQDDALSKRRRIAELPLLRSRTRRAAAARGPTGPVLADASRDLMPTELVGNTKPHGRSCSVDSASSDPYASL